MTTPPIAAIANLCDDVLQRLRSDYHTLSSEQLFRVLGALRPPSAGELPPDPGPPPSGGADALLPHLEAWLQRFMAERAADMPWGDVNAALGGIGAEFDRLRRSGELSGAARRLDAAPPRRSSAGAARGRAKTKSAGEKAASAAPAAGRARWVRTGATEFECVWSSENQRAELRFGSSEELGRFALALREGPSVALPLDPPPVEHSALRLVLGAKGEDKSHPVMAHVVSTGTETRLRVDALPSAMGRLAQRALEARVRATRSATARTPSRENKKESIGAESGASRPTRAVARGSRGSSRSAAPPPIAPQAAERTPSTRTPTSEQYLADRTSSRRRRAAARRASGTTRPRPFGADGLAGASPARGARSAAEAHALKSTSKRRRSDVHRPASLAGEQRPPDAASAGPTPDVSESAARATAPLREADAPRETTPLRDAAAPRDTAPLRDQAFRESDSVSQPPPPTREVPVARSEGGESAAPEGRTETGFVHTDSWSRKRTPLSVRRRPPAFEPSFGEELGTMSGEATEGGPAAVMLALASDFPAVSLVMLVAGARWRMLIREDVLLDVRQEPEDPRFDIVRLVRDSGLCEEQDLHDALEAAEQNEVTLLEQLGRERLLRYREIDAIQGSRVKTMLSYLGTARLDRWEAVGFDFVEFSGSSPVEFAADAWRSVIEAVEALPMSQVESALAKHMAARPRYRRSARLTPRALRMSAKEQKFVDAVLNGEQSIRQSVARSPLRRRASLCIVLALDRIGMIEWEQVDARSARVARAMPEIIDRLKSVEGLNPFARLDAHWSSDEVLVLEAWRDAVRSFDLAFVLEHASGDDLEAAKRLHEVLCGARDGLRTRPQREEARGPLCDAFERGAATQLYEKQAELSLFKKDVRLAADALRRVVELDPKNAKATRQLGVIRRLDDSL